MYMKGLCKEYFGKHSTAQWKLVMLKSEEQDELEDTKGES